MTISNALASWALEFRWSSVPSNVKTIIKEHCADGIGNAIGGSKSAMAQAALATIVQSGHSDKATLWNSSLRSSVPSAAFYNAILIHALDFDDTHAGGLVHATAPTLPVAWALGESLNASGDEVIAAYTVGLEVISRLGAASPHGFHARGLHATQVCGSIACALVSAKLMKLSLEQSVHAMGIAGSFAGGLLEFLNTGSSTKQIHPGIAAQAGINAATLAAHGATGPGSVLEGEYGIYRTLSNRSVDLDSITRDLGRVWQSGLITIKPYPACQLSHVTLDAARAAWAQAQANGCRSSDISSITAKVHRDSLNIICEPFTSKISPKTAYDAKFSLPWSVSVLLIDGEIGILSFSEESILRSEVTALASKFSYTPSEDHGAAAAASGEVVISTYDGHEYVGVVASSTGGPGNRLSLADLSAKFLGQGTDLDLATKVFDDLLHIDESPTIQEISAKIAKLR